MKAYKCMFWLAQQSLDVMGGGLFSEDNPFLVAPGSSVLVAATATATATATVTAKAQQDQHAKGVAQVRGRERESRIMCEKKKSKLMFHES